MAEGVLRKQPGARFALPVLTCAGMMWMSSAIDFILIFVSLELVTISFYVLDLDEIGLPGDTVDPVTNDAAIQPNWSEYFHSLPALEGFNRDFPPARKFTPCQQRVFPGWVIFIHWFLTGENSKNEK